MNVSNHIQTGMNALSNDLTWLKHESRQPVLPGFLDYGFSHLSGIKNMVKKLINRFSYYKKDIK